MHRGYPGQVCSIGRSLEIVGERWTLLILRDAVLGVERFEDFQQSLGIASNVLTGRLKLLCDEVSCAALTSSGPADRSTASPTRGASWLPF